MIRLCTFTVLVSLAGGAFAQAPAAIVEPVQNCRALAATVRAPVWETWFRGSRKDIWDREETIYDYGCFRTEAQCKAWLYRVQSDWQRNNFLPCRPYRG